MDENGIFAAYLDALVVATSPDCREYMRDGAWTPCVTTALVAVARQLYPTYKVVAKNHTDDWGRSEYLNMDVMAFPGDYGPPAFAAEHENARTAERILYDAWKLLVADVETRVLVAYFGNGAEFTSFESMADAVGKICAKNPGKNIILIGGDYNARPADQQTLRATYARPRRIE